MAKNPLLGMEESVDTAEEVEEVLEEQGLDEEVEEDEEEVEEDEEEEPAPAPVKPTRGTRASAGPKKGGSKAPGAGTLGDARIDTSVPLSVNAKTYWNALLESPLVTSIIPPDFLNEESDHIFCINSLRIIVPKGRMVQVPLLLAQEIAQSFKNRM